MKDGQTQRNTEKPGCSRLGSQRRNHSIPEGQRVYYTQADREAGLAHLHSSRLCGVAVLRWEKSVKTFPVLIVTIHLRPKEGFAVSLSPTGGGFNTPTGAVTLVLNMATCRSAMHIR